MRTLPGDSMHARRALLTLTIFALTACSGGGSGGGGGTPAPTFDAKAYFEARQEAYRDFSLAQGANGLEGQLVRLARGEAVDEQAIRGALEFVNGRNDTSDFRMTPLLRILYQFGDSPLLSAQLKGEIERTVLDFKYWIDEPGVDGMVYWSENHQVLFHSAEYLAGQLFPNEVFTNNGMTGAQHKEKAEALFREWARFRSEIGFTEFHSSNYYEEDVGPLVNLADFAEDPEVATISAMLADLFLFDLAMNSQEGAFGGSHGRTVEKNVIGGQRESTSVTNVLVFNQHEFVRTGGLSTHALALATQYVPAAAVLLAGMPENQPETWTDKERMGVRVEDAADYGLTTDPLDFASTLFWWSSGDYALPETIDSTFQLADAYGLFEAGDFFPILKPLVPLWEAGLLPGVIAGDAGLKALTAGIGLPQVNTIAYHNPEAMLGSLQDGMAGQPSFQNHSWTAVLGFDATVFTTHPLVDDEVFFGDYLGYFTGGASHPRIAQELDVLIAIYNPIINWPTFIFPAAGTTHAYFPFDKFDETASVGNWTFARLDDGYVALYSRNPTHVRMDGRFPNRDIVAEGPKNVWICEIGWEDEDGTFEEFVDRIAAEPVAVDADLNVTYGADLGEMKFGWTGPLTVGGDEVPIADYPRYDNPFTRVERGERRYVITAGGVTSILDFDAVERIAD